MKRIAIFASGSGSNAENIIQYFNQKKTAEVALILSNNSQAYVLERAKKYDVPTFVFNSNELKEGQVILDILKSKKIDLIVLAGFMKMIPSYLINAYPDKIINIHPALLPKYGGKGMYGSFVHEAVKNAGEKESGITIHYVNERYDEGAIIFQATCPVEKNDTADDIASKVHQLEYKYFPEVIEKIILYI